MPDELARGPKILRGIFDARCIFLGLISKAHSKV